LEQAPKLETPRKDLLNGRQDRAQAGHIPALLLELVDHFALVRYSVGQRGDMLVKFL